MQEYDDDEIDYIDESSLSDVPVAWEALEDAFENNAHEVHSYLHLDTGEVIRVVDGVADPAMHNRIMSDRHYMRVDSVSSREQYRWMERFIATVEDDELRPRLTVSIDGKGAFRRFKDVLMSDTPERERWFIFRSERLRSNMESWLAAHGIRAVDRPQWQVPEPEPVPDEVTEKEQTQIEPRDVSVAAEAQRQASEPEPPRQSLHALVDSIPTHEVPTAEAFLEFLQKRAMGRRAKASPNPATISVANVVGKAVDA